jgi:hypothetical protein
MTFGSAIPILAWACLAVAHAENPNRPVAKPPAQPAQTPKSERPAQGAKPNKNDPNLPKKKDTNFATAENLAKLLKLSPDQRTKALASLPPARRQQIEKRIEDYQKMPEMERARQLDRLRRMQGLPPQRQAQVRSSVAKLQALPAPRHSVVQRQINQMRPLTDVDRSALMNSEEFRSKFTPAEQQIIADICLVTPQELTARKERPRPQ